MISRSPSPDSSLPDGMAACPGSYPRLTTTGRSDAEAVSSPVYARHRSYAQPATARLGLGIASPADWQAVPRAPVAERQSIASLAAPPSKSPGASRLASLSFKYLKEVAGIRDGDTQRRRRMDGIIELMGADFAEWSSQRKDDANTHRFIVRCRGHLNKLNKISEEHEFMTSSSGSRDSTEIATANEFTDDLAKIRRKLGGWIEQSILETDLSLFQEFAAQIDSLREHYHESHRPIVEAFVGEVTQACSTSPFLSQISREALDTKLNALGALLHD